MSLVVFLAVLLAAAVHAGWNGLVKAAADKATATRFVAFGAGVVGALALPFLTPPASAALPWLAVSAVLQIGYYVLLAAAYRAVDLTVAYPLMRGLAPMLVAIAGVGLFGEALGLGGWIGVAAISAGVAGLVFAGRARRAGLLFAVANAAVIAAYTVVDAHAARLSGSPVAYAAWEAIATAVPLALWGLKRGDVAPGRIDLRSLAVGLVGGAATTTSYAIALWAMTQAPVAVVAALRETSIVFALALGRGVFGETIGRARLTAAAVVVAGVVVLKTV